MNSASKWRLDKARELVAAIAADPGLRAAIITGAVADEIADDYSETHLHLFWEELPSIEQQQDMLDRVGGESFYGVEELQEGIPAEGYAPFVLPAIVSDVDCAGYWSDSETGTAPIQLSWRTIRSQRWSRL